MEIKELRNNLVYLVNKYIKDDVYKNKLLDHIKHSEVPGVKGILAEIQKSDVTFDSLDEALIKEIVFNYV